MEGFESSILGLYTKWKERDWKLVSSRASISDEVTKIQEYIMKMAPSEDLSRSSTLGSRNLTGPPIQAVKRCPRDSQTHNSKV